MEFKTIKDICKLGQYELCCRYLTATSKGFECAKLTPLKSVIDKKVEGKNFVAQGDNCDGIETTKRQKDEYAITLEPNKPVISKLIDWEVKSEVELVCIFESDKPTCNCEFEHCLKKGY